MPRSYSPEMRREVVELARSGTRVKQLAVTFAISEATVYNWTKCSGSEVRRRIGWSGGLGGGSVELLREAVEVGAGELPLEWGGDLLVAAAERE